MGLLDKLLAIALGVTLLGTAGALWYGDHEHARIAPLEQQVSTATRNAAQAAADRDAAIKAASDAQVQLQAAQDALANAAQAAASAAQAASAARGKLSTVAKQSPDAAAVLNMPVPSSVWGAIFNQTGK